MKDYAIMHLNRHVATIRGDGSCTVYFPRFMPYNLYLVRADAGDLDVRMNNLNNFYYWCATRLLTLDRKYAKEILNSLGMKQAVTDRERAGIAISYHALCLTDVYWVRELRKKVTYTEINLYDHSLSDAFVDVSLRGRPLTAENAEMLDRSDAAGDLATAGVAPKAWVRRGSGFWLLKDGDPREVEAELTASQIARCFDVAQVLYEPETYQGVRVSASRLMTTKERSIVPMQFVDIYAANTDRTTREIVSDHDLRGYHMMNIVDYLVGNTDRHWGNWGFEVDNRTNRLVKLHPLMDFNKAFNAYDSVEGATCLAVRDVEGEIISQREAAVRGVRAIGLNQVKALPDDLAGLFHDANLKFSLRLDIMFRMRLDVIKEAEEAR